MAYYQESNPEKEAEIAQQALQAGDLQHAIYHIGTALQFAPDNQQWLGVLEEIIRRTPDALTLVRMDDKKSDYITAATRAYVLAKRGDFAEALALLAQAANMRPDRPFLAWGAQWLRAPGAAARVPFDVAKGRIIAPLLQFVGQMPTPVPEDHECYKSVHAAGAVLAALGEVYPEESFLLFARSIVGRRQGQFEWAVYWAHEAFQRQQDWNTAAGVALAKRDAGNTEEAVSWFRHAHSLDQNELSPLLDIGDTYLDAERYQDAIAAYDEVLAKRDGHPWAVATKVFAQFKLGSDPALKHELFRLADHSGRAWDLYCQLQPPEPYVHTLPGASDATAHGVRDVTAQMGQDPKKADGASIKFTVTHPESPSVLTAFRLWTASRNIKVNLDLQVEKIQSPDPRTPKGQVNPVLWAYTGNMPRPNVPEPDPRAAEAIAKIASTTYNLEYWVPLAQELGQQMGAGWMQQLLYTAVHPPALPGPDMDPLKWVYRCQMAAALTIAYTEEAWEPSHRKQALYAMILGPVDWTVDAGIVALGWLGRSDPQIRQEAAQLFAWLKDQIPAEGYTCFEYPLACAWLGMGEHDPETEKMLQTWKQEIEDRQRAAPDTDEPQLSGAMGPESTERLGGITLEQYAELSVRRDALLQKHGMGAGGAMKAMMGGGVHPELVALCREFGIDPKGGPGGAGVGHVPEWDDRINGDGHIAEMFFAMQNDARLKVHGTEFNSHEGRVAEMIRTGHFDTEGAKVNAQAAAQQMAAGQGGDPDPEVFPGQPLARLSDYVGLMKAMQAGDMMGALAKYGLDMGAYGAAAQAWGIKLASDPSLTAKFGQMMA